MGSKNYKDPTSYTYGEPKWAPFFELKFPHARVPGVGHLR